METRPPPIGVAYAQVAQGQNKPPQTNVLQPHSNGYDTSSKRPNRTQTNYEKPVRSDGHTHQPNNGAHQ